MLGFQKLAGGIIENNNLDVDLWVLEQVEEAKISEIKARGLKGCIWRIGLNLTFSSLITTKAMC